MTTKEKVKLDRKTYRQLRRLLSSSDEDFEIACESIKNMDISSIAVTLLAKHLVFDRRNQYMEKFTERIRLTIGEVYKSNEAIRGTFDFSWKNIIPQFVKSPYLTELDKEIITFEIEELVGQTLVSLDYTFIKNLKLELEW